MCTDGCYVSETQPDAQAIETAEAQETVASSILIILASKSVQNFALDLMFIHFTLQFLRVAHVFTSLLCLNAVTLLVG